jgi:hypothetical protein
MGAYSADLPTIRVDHLPERKITITAVEFTVAPTFTCDVFYWHPQDEDMNGDIDSCRHIEYDPCIANDGDRVLIKYVLSGGDCNPPPLPPECDFSPKDPRCP